MPAASPSFVDQIRTLMNERAALLARRIEIDGQVSLIDAELSEARQLLGAPEPIKSAAVVPPHVGPAPAPRPVHDDRRRDEILGTAFIDARDAAVFARIMNNNGVATIQELRKWFLASAVCGSGTDAVKHEALTNTLHRLKAKNQISRTGDTIVVPKGETQYRILLDDDEVELLAKGICPERVALRAYDMLWWKREYYRVEAREKTTA